MNIYITLDYELYFGKQHGTAEKCILYPTSELIRIAEKYNVRFSFFVDCGYLKKLEQYKNKYPKLQAEYTAVRDQIKYLSATGHDIQLHIHPHWEDTTYNGTNWDIDVSRYKLADFQKEDVLNIVKEYKEILEKITTKKVFAYRAGGWCMQPFDHLKEAFKRNGIWLDSTVFKNGFYMSKEYFYDFRNAPDKDIYHFENDPAEEDFKGYFTELPLASVKNSPLFFWKLFLLGRLNPYFHKPLGDGKAMPAPGYRKKILTRTTINPATIDGFNAALLQNVLNKHLKKKFNHMVVLGHPKALSRFSISALESFVIKHHKNHNFTTYSQVWRHDDYLQK
jgi:peptidoglycan/xylan/chitin deacetylase (PgdA/CDA1 family)